MPHATPKLIRPPYTSSFRPCTCGATYKDDCICNQVNEQPVRLFKLPYADELYLCTCGATVRSDCTCSQETVLTTHENPHLRDPETVVWLLQQDAPFTIENAAEALKIELPNEKKFNAQLIVRMRLHRELTSCGCSYDAGTSRFTAPDVDTLRRLHLRPPVGSRSPREESQSSQAAPDRHRELSPAPHASRQSPPDDQPAENDLPARQQSA